MPVYNLGQLRQFIAQNLGIENSANPPVYDFDSSTPFTQTQVNNWINDEIRSITSGWDYTFLENTKSINFYNVTSGVQGISCSGNINGTGIFGSVAPYPPQPLMYSITADNSVSDIQNNFSGVIFNGTDASGNVYTGVTCISGSVTFNNTITGINNTFQLDGDVGKILGVFIQSSANGSTGYGIPLNELTYHNFAIKYPIGVVNVSGTPYEYCKLPGLDPNNNLQITLAPYPTPNFSGNSLVLDYMKKHVDLVNDTDVQNVIPGQYQQSIIFGVCETVCSFYSQMDPRVEKFFKKKDAMIIEMKQFDFNQSNLQRQWLLGNQNGPWGMNSRSAFDTSVNIYV